MTGAAIIFYLIAALILVTGILAVTTAKIFRSAIFLLFSLVGIAALYFWMEVEFIAAVQIIVYVGGIVVLIIFSIFLTQQSGAEMTKPKRSRIIFSLLSVLLGLAFCGSMICAYGFAADIAGSFTLSVATIGTGLLNAGTGGYLLPFELVSMLLLAAMIGCIVIAMKNKPEDTTI